jgi:hypothetical protein
MFPCIEKYSFIYLINPSNAPGLACALRRNRLPSSNSSCRMIARSEFHSSTRFGLRSQRSARRRSIKETTSISPINLVEKQYCKALAIFLEK